MIPGNRHDAISTRAAIEAKSDVHGANSCRNKSGLEDKGDMTRYLYVTTATSFLRKRGLFVCHSTNADCRMTPFDRKAGGYDQSATDREKLLNEGSNQSWHTAH
ncbi:hypothetical protein PMI08_00156 [Brevibacillus sp. CF112]|nr:hypothetical protein PMI08_00156 [Brevibacillus sp. CF112]